MTPETLDKWRAIPRILMLAYAIAFYRTTEWFMALEEPNNAQSAFVSVVVGAGAVWFSIYVNGKPTTHSAQTRVGVDA